MEMSVWSSFVLVKCLIPRKLSEWSNTALVKYLMWQMADVVETVGCSTMTLLLVGEHGTDLFELPDMMTTAVSHFRAKRERLKTV